MFLSLINFPLTLENAYKISGYFALHPQVIFIFFWYEYDMILDMAMSRTNKCSIIDSITIQKLGYIIQFEP